MAKRHSAVAEKAEPEKIYCPNCSKPTFVKENEDTICPTKNCGLSLVTFDPTAKEETAE